ncbi:MAG TPA: AAA family ATPase [Acidimicrobiales bacterium]|jgi:tetratricopeptide (TPR) repeat protein|nr:AAA family ATPase [Acidimicrobiales bacterium]
MARRLVGRASEVEVGLTTLDRAAGGRGSVLVVNGEPGIGKTRLAHEWADAAGRRGYETVWASGWSGAGAPPYWPWSEVLTTIEHPELINVARDAPDSGRFAWFLAVTDAIWARSASAPLLIVLDDAHEVDADGLLLTRFVAQRVARHPIVLVVTHRSTPDVRPAAADVLVDMAASGTAVPLRGLDAAGIEAFVVEYGSSRGGLAGQADAPDAAGLAKALEAQTGGNPFLLEELLAAGAMGPALPDGARRLLRAQLDALDAGAVAAVEAAAVLGSEASIWEVAEVAGLTADEAGEARRLAARAGLARVARPDRFELRHHLAREMVVDGLAPERRAVLHGRCIDALGATGGADRRIRVARHALARAELAPAHLDDSAVVVRTCAAELLSQGSPETAAGLLAELVDRFSASGRRVDPQLRAELGLARQATGRLADARAELWQAASGSSQVDACVEARIALGLGGVWVGQHRAVDDRRAYGDLLDRAIERLERDPAAADAASLLASLHVRRSAERAIAGAADVADVRAAVAQVRATGDDRHLAAALSLLHHVLLGPEHGAERRSLAREQLDVARACGDELHALIARMWWTVDQLLAGRDADRSLAELRERSDALGMRAMTYVADAIDVMRLQRAGQLDAAERAAVACRQLGNEVGDADAELYHGAHILATHWFRGTAGELLPFAQSLADSAVLPSENPIYTATVAYLAAAGGDTDAAVHALARLDAASLARTPTSSSWLVTMFALVEATVALGDRDLARQLYDALSPHGELPLIGSVGVCCFGSAHWSLGRAAAVSGDRTAAIEHFERASRANQQLGNRPMTAICRAELSRLLAERAAPGDHARAAGLLGAAIAAGRAMGLHARVEEWELRRAELPATEEGDRGWWLRRADGWEVVGCGERAQIRHSVGMQHLAALLASPCVEVTAGSLAGVELVQARQPLVDASTIEALRRRVGDLERAIDDAVLDRREEDRAELQRELEEVLDHARSVARPGGGSRVFDDPAERARTAVQKAIRRAVRSVGAQAPQLGSALEASVRTGHRCCYVPVGDAPVTWTVQTSVDR